MKRILIFSFILLCSLQISAQSKDSHREKIKALKTAHITEGLNLSSQEAEKFWPIYNEYEEKRRALYRKEREDIENLERISEEKAAAMLEEYVDLERQDYLLKKKFFSDLRSIFSAKKIIQLKKVEDDFNRQLIKEYRERHSVSHP